MGQKGATQLGSPLLLATAQAKMQGDRATAGEGSPSASIQRGRNLNEGMKRQAETGKMAGGSGKGKFKARECCYIVFFKGGLFQRIFTGNFSAAIDISLRDTSSLVKTSTS